VDIGRLEFRRNYRSVLSLERLLVFTPLIFLTIFFILYEKYIFSLIPFVLAVYLIYNFLSYPNIILIENKGITYGKEQILWSQIKTIKFTVNPGRDYMDRWIVIYFNDKERIIHTNLYYDPKKLRNTCEKICKEMGIKYIVEDRGGC